MLETASKLSPHLIALVLMLFISMFARQILVLTGQTWVKTLPHTATVILLPIITFVITKVIAGNIALSLGMVGALSIVRFRNPVRSPLELTVYFGAITVGVTASVSVSWLSFFAGAILVSSMGLYCVNLAYKFFAKQNFYESSFMEGNSMSSLVVVSSNPLAELAHNPYLGSVVYSDDTYRYTFYASSYQKLEELLEIVEKDNGLTHFALTR